MFMGGCVTTSTSKGQWKPVVRHDGNKVHVVKWQDETLPAISRWYTGSVEHVDAIANANPTLDPTSLKIGERIFIPPNILKTRADLSRPFLDEALSLSTPAQTTTDDTSVTKEPRIIEPRALKEKMGDEVAVDGGADLQAVAPPAVPEVVAQSPESDPPVEDDVDLQLFGPK